MSDEIVTLKVRATSAFREKLALTAKENNRSMNAEIIARLEQSFEDSNQMTKELIKDAVLMTLEAIKKHPHIINNPEIVINFENTDNKKAP
ncbi:MAG TPA: Arc family DNA-binding protein [Acinetobacter ursingii]|uniref:Arc family DNA-binding protein n=3 Tax=Acinetobacter ursingii TaxID=108980 RepID=A0A3D2SJR9_9GAMM|nr:Arc family DNA-binding protein [Acinetobacter ursingii]MCH2003988.1 Arc family DNA-binding protein [Acinetobacter ursingii]MCU4380715.1 Arc family DNA-binding protein [Acinetobacter ursingii]HCK29042.1 Arc family DNA-binding protein [Acinetobacter ursingii]HCO07226.1 Arc family DNA-binding protein [Acinetobacter ursingii]